jgi:hypothetical protein
MNYLKWAFIFIEILVNPLNVSVDLQYPTSYFAAFVSNEQWNSINHPVSLQAVITLPYPSSYIQEFQGFYCADFLLFSAVFDSVDL